MFSRNHPALPRRQAARKIVVLRPRKRRSSIHRLHRWQTNSVSNRIHERQKLWLDLGPKAKSKHFLSKLHATGGRFEPPLPVFLPRLLSILRRFGRGIAARCLDHELPDVIGRGLYRSDERRVGYE